MSMNPVGMGRENGDLSNTIAAVFATEHDARETVGALRKAGFRRTWLGSMLAADSSSGEPMVEESGNQIGRFFSGAPDRLPLHQALRKRGLSERQAMEIEGDIAPGCAIVTVYGEDNPERAAELLAIHRGYVVDDTLEVPTAVAVASATPRVGVEREEAAERERYERPDAAERDRSERTSGLGTPGRPVGPGMPQRPIESHVPGRPAGPGTPTQHEGTLGEDDPSYDDYEVEAFFERRFIGGPG